MVLCFDKSSDGIAASRTGAQNTPAESGYVRRSLLSLRSVYFIGSINLILFHARENCPIKAEKNNLFRIIVMRFIDAYDFDVRSIKKSCVHIVHKDGRIIPFETMNLFYRDEKESRLRELQEMNETLPGKNKLKLYE